MYFDCLDDHPTVVRPIRNWLDSSKPRASQNNVKLAVKHLRSDGVLKSQEAERNFYLLFNSYPLSTSCLDSAARARPLTEPVDLAN
jgi:hypothetical protein